MAEITFAPINKTFPAKEGQSVIEVAMENGLEIEHACGMNCACATCHVYITDGMEHLSKMDEFEDDRLNEANERRPTSRLSCQARLLNGTCKLKVEIPEPY